MASDCIFSRQSSLPWRPSTAPTRKPSFEQFAPNTRRTQSTFSILISRINARAPRIHGELLKLGFAVARDAPAAVPLELGLGT